jgi:hypothetical protein
MVSSSSVAASYLYRLITVPIAGIYFVDVQDMLTCGRVAMDSGPKPNATASASESEAESPCRGVKMEPHMGCHRGMLMEYEL